MARVIRDCWVYRPMPRYRSLPVKTDMHKLPFDYDENQATPEHFPYKLDAPPPKLWLAWLYTPYTEWQRKYVLKKVNLLFGEDWKVGKMKVFKNTADTNRQLWELKHLIEIRPLTFPQGEPTIDDVKTMQIDPVEGKCWLKPKVPNLVEWKEKPQMTTKYMISFNSRKWTKMTEQLFEDAVWTDPNVSRAS